MSGEEMDQRPRKLIVCLDGTWNQRDSKEAPTNVAKIARAIAPVDEDGVTQLIYYHPGVGSGDWFDSLVGGAFGAGLSANIESAYSFLADNCQDNDLIYLFGFSRGAFTARSLAGLVSLAGILRKSDMQRFQTIFDIYRLQKNRGAILGANDATRSEALKEAFPNDAKLREELDSILHDSRRRNVFFIGVWDTVGSLGVPLGPLRWVTMRRYGFHNTDLSPSVRYAYQALAVDERRRIFKPTLWTRTPRAADSAPQELQQVWFAGCHSNVGGGYDDSGLSDMSFLWMAAMAHAAVPDDNRDTYKPLKFEDTYFTVDNFDQKWGTLVNSRTGFWYILPGFVRGLMEPQTNGKETCEKIHRSVVMRHDRSGDGSFAPKRYRPRNARRYLKPLDATQIAELTDFEIRYRPSYAPQSSS
jgi:uncharacterized protein (DUF2235 family)